MYSSSAICHANYVWFAKDQGFVFPRVESRMCLWCRQGKGQVTVNGMAHPFHEGDYLFLPWGHRIAYLPDPKAPFLLGGIHIVPDHSRTVPVEFEVPHDPTHPLAGCAWRRDSDLGRLASIMAFRGMQETPLWALSDYIVQLFLHGWKHEERLRALAAELLAALVDAVDSHHLAAQPQPNSAFQRLREHVRHNLAAPFTANQLAAFLNCSQSTANRLCRANAGLSLRHWVRRQRLEQARLLLVGTRLPISEVGRRVGIENPFHFSKSFKQWVGESPRAYRQRTPLI